MKLVAVTSCPTGIAHSQMAAENLEQTADRLGHDIKVEVQGAMGAENELSSGDIAEADAVIVASDTSVSRDRFEGKPLVKGTVKDGVNDAEGLIEKAADLVESGAAETVEVGGDTADADAPEAESASESAADPEPQQQRRRGGDREKGLFARLKKLFS
ncbi:PTS system, fructose-specific IIB component [Halopelagius inordinatus]|uniref:PTS system, fructose-specific IIB component n=1 Tax=Halopelagius inordinatus TaxID=553467 RepID=A0A1I2PK83_9EURY|nr:PTS fructose transporter subunit IIB [Halopelagius inordinatus]SFG16572.1 PTS system, fructose-specific IIB component [Halopelagius inordinatus]